MNPGNESRQFGDVQDRADDPSGAAGGIVFDHHPGKLDDVVRAVGLEDPVRDGGRLAGSKGAARQAPDALPVVGWHGLEICLNRHRFSYGAYPTIRYASSDHSRLPPATSQSPWPRWVMRWLVFNSTGSTAPVQQHRAPLKRASRDERLTAPRTSPGSLHGPLGPPPTGLHPSCVSLSGRSCLCEDSHSCIPAFVMRRCTYAKTILTGYSVHQ